MRRCARDRYLSTSDYGCRTVKFETTGGHQTPCGVVQASHYEDRTQHLHVNARYAVSLTKGKAAESEVLFRLRDQILNELIYRLHGYAARPGVIALRP